MYPIRDPALDLYTIAEHWLNFLGKNWTHQKVENALLRAFWKGELESENLKRESLLPLLRRAEHPGIRFYNPGTLNEVEEHPDGSVTIILNAIPLQENKDEWQDAEVKNAYAILAGVKIDDYGEPLIPALLGGIIITYAAFGKWCKQYNWKYKNFWNCTSRYQKPLYPSDAEKKAAAFIREFTGKYKRDEMPDKYNRAEEWVYELFNNDKNNRGLISSFGTKVWRKAWIENTQWKQRGRINRKKAD